MWCTLSFQIKRTKSCILSATKALNLGRIASVSSHDIISSLLIQTCALLSQRSCYRSLICKRLKQIENFFKQIHYDFTFFESSINFKAVATALVISSVCRKKYLTLELFTGPSLAIVLEGGFQVPFSDKAGKPAFICRQIWSFADHAPKDDKKLLVCARKFFSRGLPRPQTPPIATGLVV